MATTKPKSAPAKSAPLKKDDTAKTSVAVRKPSSGAIVSIKEQLAAQAAAMNERVQPASGNRIRTKAGKFILPDGNEAESLQLVIVDFVSMNSFYPGKFDPKNIQPPSCFAIGSNPKALVPSDNSPDKQSDSCAGCPMNEFGSSGEGKACKNGRRLAVLPPDAEAGTELWTLDVPPTALKNFDGYVSSVARNFQMPPVGVVTTVTLDPTVDYAKPAFADPQPNDNLGLCFSRQEEARQLLAAEPDVSGFVPAKPAARKAAAGRR